MDPYVTVISFANYQNKGVVNLEKTLKNQHYNYKIIGDGQEWKGFMTKCQAYSNCIATLPSKSLVAIVDAFDVLATGPSEELYDKYMQNYRGKIVYGAESMLMSKFSPIDTWWKYKHWNSSCTRFRYLNSGFIMGPKEALLEHYQFIFSLKINDDQICGIHFFNKYPEQCELDFEQRLVVNITPIDGKFITFDHEKKRIRMKTRDMYPCFAHIPGGIIDFNYRIEKIGHLVLQEQHECYNVHDSINNVYYEVEKRKYTITTGTVLSILLLYYSNPILFSILRMLIICFLLSFFYVNVQYLIINKQFLNQFYY